MISLSAHRDHPGRQHDRPATPSAILRYRASTVVFLLVVGAMMVPMQSIIVPEYINLATTRLHQPLLGAILVYAALGAPFSTFLMTTYLRRLPEDVIEAALIDGLGYGRVFLRDHRCRSRVPAMATIAVLQFIQIWDDLLVGLLFLQTPNVRPITVGLATIPGAARARRAAADGRLARQRAAGGASST